MKNINSRIIIKSEQSADGEVQRFERLADCSMHEKNGKIVAFYAEDDNTLEGTESVLKFENNVLTLRRRGAYSCEMVFCEGCEKTFIYHMPYGSVDMSIKTERLDVTADEKAVSFSIEYKLINGTMKQHNSVNIVINRI